MINVLLLVAGLALILFGADFLTDGASSLAKRFRISSMVIGLTVVAFGTSTPELSVSVLSALEGNAELSIGNVVGSNIFNILMIVGITAIVAPIAVRRATLTKEIPLAVLSSVVVLICANHLLLGTDTANVIDSAEVLLMLCFFSIFMGYTFAIARDGDAAGQPEIKSLPLWRCLIYIVGGLAALIGGGTLFVNGASEIARSLGVSESVIGLTLVAMGTSLPELATSVVAALKKNPEIAIGNVIGSVMNAAKATVSQNLDNMRSAYEAHGGGIRGAAAAAVEGVKGIYTAGFTFLDNLTGGRLSAIRDKFVGFVTNIASGVSERFTAVKTAFSNGITAIKNSVSGGVTWFFESGKRVVTTFANGIKSAFTGAVDAVKGGLQCIRNMLPFSDAKEGPLSTLTLSGQRTMTTYAHGLELAQNEPAEEVEKGLNRAKTALDRDPVKKVPLTSTDAQEGSTEGGEGTSGSAKQIIIQKLLIPVDLKKIKDLQQLLALLKEVEDYANANGGEDAEGDPDAVPSPA